MLHRWSDEIVIGWFHELAVLANDVRDSATTLCYIALNTSRQANVIWRQHENFEVHHLTVPLLKNGVNALEDNYWGRFNNLNFFGACMRCKIITWNLAVLSSKQLTKFFKSKIEVQCVRMIKIVRISILMVLLPKMLF